jgi:hypothetical protein
MIGIHDLPSGVASPETLDMVIEQFDSPYESISRQYRAQLPVCVRAAITGQLGCNKYLPSILGNNDRLTNRRLDLMIENNH